MIPIIITSDSNACSWPDFRDIYRFRPDIDDLITRYTHLRNISTSLPERQVIKGSLQALLIEKRSRDTERFKKEHELTDPEFHTDHWQTIFAMQYPKIRV